MNLRNFIKGLIVLVVVALATSLLSTWYKTFVEGRYYQNASLFMTALGWIAPVLIGAMCFLIARATVRYKGHGGMGIIIALAIVSQFSTACSRSSANMITLISDDCGRSWKVIPTGETIPIQNLPCELKVTIPGYPMPGNTVFRTSFANRVIATIELSYEYEIIDGAAFISEARYLGKTNTDPDAQENAYSKYETAENSVIDRRLREAASELLKTEDLVDFVQATFEEKLLETANEILRTKGVKLNYISFVPILEEQTRLAVDILTAVRVYESRGLGKVGTDIAVARAGATQITVNAGSASEQKQ